MKRILLTGVIAAALFAGSAFAAGFDVNTDFNSEEFAWVSSGSADVEACAEHVKADLVPINESILDEDDWLVGSVRVRISGDWGEHHPCWGHDVTGAILGDGNVLTETETKGLFGPFEVLNLDVLGDEPYVADVDGVSILIDEPNV